MQTRAHDLDKQVTTLHIGAIDIGDLDFTSAEKVVSLLRCLDHIVVVKI